MQVCAVLCWLVMVGAGLCWPVLARAGLCWLVLACDGLCLPVLMCVDVCWPVLARAGWPGFRCHTLRLPALLGALLPGEAWLLVYFALRRRRALMSAADNRVSCREWRRVHVDARSRQRRAWRYLGQKCWRQCRRSRNGYHE